MSRRNLVALALLLTLWAPAGAQPTPSPVTSPTASASASDSATPSPTLPSPTPVTVDDMSTQLASTGTALTQLEAQLDDHSAEDEVDKELKPFSLATEQRARATYLQVEQSPSLQDLRGLEQEWRERSQQLHAWKDQLVARETQLDAATTQLDQLHQLWSATRSAERASLPAPILEQIRHFDDEIDRLRGKVRHQRNQISLLQTQIAREETRVADALASVSQAHDAMVRLVMVQDGRPIWEVRPGQELDHFPDNLLTSLNKQLRELESYAQSSWDRLLLQLASFLTLLALLNWARQKVQPWVAVEPSLERTAAVFSTPVSAALLLTVFLAPNFYPHAPVMLTAAMGALMLIPANLVLRRLLALEHYPILNALLVFFCLDVIRTLTSEQVLLTRVCFLGEMSGALAFLAWFLISKQPRPLRLPGAAPAAVALFSVALVSNCLGYLTLSTWLGEGALRSAYVATILLACVEIAQGLTMLSLQLPPLSLLASVRGHRALFRERMRRLYLLVAGLVWLLVTAEYLSLRGSLFRLVGQAISLGISIGTLRITTGGVAASLLGLWMASQLSRLTHFFLEQDVYPRLSLERGVDYTLSTLVHYLILLLGLLFGLSALGIDMTRITIVAGALSVGIGFGLQNLVNNFVSGLILLFERPVKVGDTIQVADQLGVLVRVGLRASVVRTLEGAEVIVPNGQLLSNQVTNWTLTDQHRRLQVSVGVAYGSDPRRVVELLLSAIRGTPEILESPPPEAIFAGFGDSSLNFQVLAWTDHSQRWTQIQSELLLRINEILTEAGISIPFPTRTVHVDSWPGPPPAPTSSSG